MPKSRTDFWHPKVVKDLLHYRSSVNLNDSDHRSPLWAASKHGHVAVVEALLQKDADVDAGSGTTAGSALSVAAERGHPEVVRRNSVIEQHRNSFLDRNSMCL